MAAYKTAIARKTLSAPVKALRADLAGRVLDYGCGRGSDARELGCESFDPHYQPVMPSGVFDTIICNYVLNVIESDKERRSVLCDIAARLRPSGIAYITVRADKKALTGHKKDTWQGYIELDLPVVQRASGYVTYAMLPHQYNCEMKATTFDK